MHPVEDQTICKSIEKKHATFKTPPNGKMLDNKGLLSKTHLDPKLVQVAQLFVQDLINRARLEVQRNNPEQVTMLLLVFQSFLLFSFSISSYD